MSSPKTWYFPCRFSTGHVTTGTHPQVRIGPSSREDMGRSFIPAPKRGPESETHAQPVGTMQYIQIHWSRTVYLTSYKRNLAQQTMDEPDAQWWPEGFELPSRDEEEEVPTEQWIEAVTGRSSQYGGGERLDWDDDDGDIMMWSAGQVVGPPRVQHYEDNGFAWAPAIPGTSQEWLELRVARPCRVQRVRIHESLSGGAFFRLQLYDPDLNQFVTAVEQEPRCGQYPPVIRIEDIHVPAQHQIVTDRLRLEFNQRGGNTWYEVDAVQVIGTTSNASSSRNLVAPLSDRQTTLAKDISALLKDSNTADCTLVVGGNVRIPVHRGILAARCPLFRAMLDNAELPLGGEKVMDGIEPALAELILEWIYTGNLADLDSRDCVALVVASDYFQIDGLTDYCVAVFTGLLTVQNAALLLAHFDHICIEPLKEAALGYCGKYFLAVSQTPEFGELSQQLLLAVIDCYKCCQEGTEEN